MREVEVRIDPYTQEKFFPKRSNQVFATPQNKMMYHNEKAKEYRDETKKVRSRLDRNNKLFESLLGDNKKARFHVEYLRGKGVDLKAVTRVIKIGDEVIYKVFDFTFRHDKEDENYVIISRRFINYKGFLA
ncbi:MAG: hypothetical protein ACOYMB_05310 [Patescibacteria group bacterium]